LVGGWRFMLSGGDYQFTAHMNRRRRARKVSKNFRLKEFTEKGGELYAKA
jgi:hypothetical protein